MDLPPDLLQNPSTFTVVSDFYGLLTGFPSPDRIPVHSVSRFDYLSLQ